MRYLVWTGVACLLVGVLAGCATRGQPVIVDRTSVKSTVTVDRGHARSATAHGRSRHTYAVRRGDTLYRIAWRYGLTVEALAHMNRLQQPYTIYPGQELRISRSAAQTRRSTPPVQQDAKIPQPGSDSPVLMRESGRDTPGSARIEWTWPVALTPSREFGHGNKGLDFQLRPGTPVQAAADGEVVYAGAGLGGYETLVIIRHPNGFLSAYSLNSDTSRKEGETIKRGDSVAVSRGSGRSDRLHFEIRKEGDPVSPRLLLDGPGKR